MYGICADDRHVMRARSWRWLRTHIEGLITRPPRVTPDGQSMPTTRLGWRLFPPKSER